MIKVALINSLNEVTSIVSPSDDSMYEDGKFYGEHLAVHVPISSNISMLRGQYYLDGEFIDKPERPTQYYNWNGTEWDFDQDRLFADFRSSRDVRLSWSDWTQIPDSPLTKAKREEWATYRQALRDLPAQLSGIESLDDVQWPLKPEA